MNSCEFVERREWGSMVAQLQYSSTKPKWSLKNDGDSSCSRDQKSLYVPVIIGHRRRRKDITSVTSFNLVVEVQGILYGLGTILKELILWLALFLVPGMHLPSLCISWQNNVQKYFDIWNGSLNFFIPSISEYTVVCT